MQMVKLDVVEKPASFADVKFTEAEWAAANKLSAKVMPYATALDNVRNSKGMYRIVVEKPVVEVEIKGLKEPKEMTSAELIAEMTSHGKPPRKKMARSAAIDFVKDLRQKAAEFIIDDE